MSVCAHACTDKEVGGNRDMREDGNSSHRERDKETEWQR